MINNLICEHPLPLPSSITDKHEDFKDIVWDEHTFYTSSFFSMEEIGSVSTYTITSDGQFYRESTETEVEMDEDGSLYPKERNKGIEKQDFTGLISFGTEILGKDQDHSIDFKALFYKGELKELELEEHKSHSNEKRKAAVVEISEHFKRETERQNSLRYKIFSPFKKFAFFTIAIIKWVMHKIFSFLTKMEFWIAR